MQIKLRKNKGTAILDLKGNFDVNAANFIEAIGDILHQGFKKIVCNFENLNMIDYLGLSGLAIAYKDICNHKAHLKLYNVPVHIKNIFSLLMLDNVFEIYASETEALDSFTQDEGLAEIEKKKWRRRFKRLPIELKVKFKPKFSSAAFFEGKIFNLSAIGIFIYTKNVFNLNDILSLRLPLGSEKKTIELDVRVVWLADRKLQPQVSPGMGVEFYKIPNKLQKKIIDFVDKNISRTRPIE